MSELANAILESFGLLAFTLVLLAVCLLVAILAWVALVELDAWCQRRWPVEDEG